MTQPSTQKLPDDTVAAVQAALGTEHAAIWVYGLVSAFLPASFDAPLTAGATAHRARRDAIARLLGGFGVEPEPAKPAYLTPQPVTNQASALAVLVTAEQDATVAWRATLERCDDAEVRKTALASLTAASVQAVKWRKLAGVLPLTPAQPGLG
ncbi:ferritin-like domain-containing protein [Actinokineospora sp. HUAS TT18]|uniref:ferritin-like domain-containing protein n=1 Tax=Actinokineospora sp. HUAS TT18 TaxID=3447451 RepID=UPI003F525220